MPDLTSNFGFRKPLQTEDYNIDDQNFNWEKADTMIGLHLCTSLTRPGSPALRQQIYETDTGQTYVWDGAVWVRTTAGTVSVKRWNTPATLATNSNQNEFYTGMSTGDIYLEAERLYRLRAAIEWDCSATDKEITFRIRQSAVAGALWGMSRSQPSAESDERYTQYVEAIIITNESAGDRDFLVTAQRETSGTATVRTYGSLNFPFMNIELLGGNTGVLTDV